MKRTILWILLLLPILSQPVLSRADDWPQFRRDTARSALSTDDLKFPLVEAWSWSKHPVGTPSPLYYVAVSKGSAYFTSTNGRVRSLVCADSLTGKVKWQKDLAKEALQFPISNVAGPAVTSDGVVFVYDWFSAAGMPESINVSVEGTDCSFGSVDSFCVRTFDADTGKDGRFFPMAAMGANGVLRRMSLVENDIGQEVRPVPATFAGCPP